LEWGRRTCELSGAGGSIAVYSGMLSPQPDTVNRGTNAFNAAALDFFYSRASMPAGPFSCVPAQRLLPLSQKVDTSVAVKPLFKFGYLSPAPNVLTRLK
jgi:hypothetical protein